MIDHLEIIRNRIRETSQVRVHDETGISFYWIRKLMQDVLKDPRIDYIATLYEYLTGEPFPPLLQETQELLANDSRSAYQLATITGLTPYWINQFRDNAKQPGYNRTVILHNALTGASNAR